MLRRGGEKWNKERLLYRAGGLGKLDIKMDVLSVLYRLVYIDNKFKKNYEDRLHLTKRRLVMKTYTFMFISIKWVWYSK